MKGCIHCGACTAACTESALKIDTKSWTVSYDESLCTHCNACIRACPARALTFNNTVPRNVYPFLSMGGTKSML